MFTTYQFSKEYVSFNFKVSLPVANQLRKSQIKKGYGIKVAISTNQNILFYILFHANMSLSFSISWKYVLVVEFLEQIASCK